MGAIQEVTAARHAQEAEGGATDYPARARALRPLIEAEADAIEASGGLTGPVIDALKEARLLWVLVPEELGGSGLDVITAMRVIEELCAIDASTGWGVMANIMATGVASAYLPDEGVAVMFGGEEPAVVAGMFAPVGKATPEPGGYSLEGKFSFASGSSQASWIGTGSLTGGEGDPVPLFAFLPRDRVEFVGNWDVHGLAGTASYDFRVPPQHIDAKFTVPMTNAPRRGGPSFRMGLEVFGFASHCSVSLGILRHALQEIVRIAFQKTRAGYTGKIHEQTLFMDQFAFHEANYQAAHQYIYGLFERGLAWAAAGNEPDPLILERLRQANSWVHRIGGDLVQFCHLWAGSEAFRPSVLNRLSRDMAVATQHVVVDPATLARTAPAVMEEWRSQLPER